MIAKIGPTRLQKTAPPINTVVKTNIMNERYVHSVNVRGEPKRMAPYSRRIGEFLAFC